MENRKLNLNCGFEKCNIFKNEKIYTYLGLLTEIIFYKENLFGDHEPST